MATDPIADDAAGDAATASASIVVLVDDAVAADVRKMSSVMMAPAAGIKKTDVASYTVSNSKAPTTAANWSN